MKILHIVHQYPPDQIGGTELYTQLLAQHQVASGHRPSVFVPQARAQSQDEPALEDGIRVYRQRTRGASRQAVFFNTFRNRRAQHALTQVVERERPDVVHIQHLMGLPASLVNILNQHETPYAITLHDYWYICANAQLLTNYDQTLCSGPDAFRNCAGCFLARGGLPDGPAARRAVAPIMARRNRLLAPVLDGATAIIAPSAFIRDEYGRLGAATGRMVVVGHGLQVPDVLPPRPPADSGKLRVVYLGGISWQKGVHVLVEAAKELPDGIEVTIYGDLKVHAEYAAQLQRRAGANVTLAGRLEHEMIWPALTAADVLVVPSIWYENAPMTILEAKAVRTPVVASNLGALPEHVRDGLDGLLFAPGDAAALRRLLLMLYEHPERLQQLRSSIGPVRTIDDHVRDVEDVYRSIIH